MKVHDLKIAPRYFHDIVDGRKRFEIRKNDRDYREGDVVFLREWDEKIGYTGRECRCIIPYVLKGSDELPIPLGDGYVVFSICILAKKL